MRVYSMGMNNVVVKDEMQTKETIANELIYEVVYEKMIAAGMNNVWHAVEANNAVRGNNDMLTMGLTEEVMAKMCSLWW